MKKQAIMLSLLILSLLVLSGCATSVTLSEPQTKNKIYSGTIRHFELKCAHGTCLDFPFSLIADTILLPYTIPKTAVSFITNENNDTSNQAEDQNENAK